MQNKEFLKKIWINIQLKMQIFINNKNFYEDFLLKTEIINFENNLITFQTPNFFSKKILEESYKNKIKELFLEYTNNDFEINFQSINEEKKTNVEKKDNSINEEDNLDYKLNFDNFIVGSFNKNMYLSAKKICDDQEVNFNPLFIYGNTGLGKTHIINAIGIELKNKKLKVLLLNTEDFLRKTYNSISEGGKKIEEYKLSFENIDVLIVDDIQFLSNKEKMNEIFFNIFNSFIKKKKKIIISSDRMPNHLKIDNRMISRFNSGLTIKIDQPDINTINEIIKYKIKKNIYNIKFSEESIKFIANRFNSDIRTLEGIINKIFFQISLEDEINNIINEEKVKKFLDIEIENGLLGSGYKISPNIIIENVCTSYGVNKDLVISKSRLKEASSVRQICIFVLREKMNISYSEIGMYFSNRNHSTIIESYKKIKEKIEKDLDLKKFIENLIKNI